MKRRKESWKNALECKPDPCEIRGPVAVPPTPMADRTFRLIRVAPNTRPSQSANILDRWGAPSQTTSSSILDRTPELLSTDLDTLFCIRLQIVSVSCTIYEDDRLFWILLPPKGSLFQLPDSWNMSSWFFLTWCWMGETRCVRYMQFIRLVVLLRLERETI